MKLKGDKFSAILKIIKESSPTLKISILSEKISETLKMSRLDAVTIMQTLIDLSGIYFSYDAKIDDFLQSLYDAIMQAKPDSEIDLNFKKFIKELLESPEFALTSKANFIDSEYKNKITGIRILTDLRPLFNEDPEVKPSHAMINHLLKLEYDCDGELKEEYFQINAKIVKKLKDYCDRALKKEESLKSAIGSIMNVLGEDND